MSGFKNFFELKYKYQDLFDSTFEKLYNKKYFGDIDKDEVRFRLTDWFIEFVDIVENKMEEELVISLCTKKSKENHLWFEAMTGYNLKNETNKVIKNTVSEYCRG
jgi:hypothetical protein